MPNYSKTSIYKICCKDTTIKDIYIGSTCNFNNRKYSHKSNCYNENGIGYNLKVYQFIRDNGGWNNWDMIQIKEFSCENKREKETEERKCVDELKPTLNSNIPNRSKKEWLDDNKEKRKTQMKEWNLKNKEKHKEKSKEYHLKNKEKINKKHREYALKNKEKIAERKRKYYLKKKELMR